MNNRLLLYVTAMVILFSLGSVTKKAYAEADLISNEEKTESQEIEEKYEALPIKTIFNMSEEESKKIVLPSMISFLEIMLSDNKVISIPCISRPCKVFSDEDKDDERVKRGILYGGDLLDSGLKEILKNDMEIYDQISFNKQFYFGEEVSSGELVFVYANKKVFFIKEYFKDLLIGDTNLKIVDEILYTFGEYVDYFLDYSRRDFANGEEMEFIKGIIETEMTLEEYKEKIYKKMINKNDWPVYHHQKMNKNNSIPNFSQEFLNTPLKSNDSIMIIFKRKNRETIKIVLVKSEYKDKRMIYFDLITGEKVAEDKTEPILTSDYSKQIPNKKETLFTNTTGLWGTLSTVKNIGYRTSGSETYELERIAHNATTIGELIEAYQYLPLELQIDYSYFDFSKNPNVDPAWLANRPTPAPTPIPTPTPTPTPAPYAELRVGNRGQEVLDMKLRFFELGYFRTDKYNDSFSDSTEDTVRLFEKNNGLKADGIADAEMLGLLFSDRAVGK